MSGGLLLPVAGAAAGALLGRAGLGPLRRQGAAWPDWLLVLGPALVWGGLSWRLGWASQLPAALGLAGVLWAVAAIDAHTHRIPNGLVLTVCALGLLAPALGGGLTPLPRGVLAAAASGLLFALLVCASRGGMGWGDAKLAAAIALVLGPAAGGMGLALTCLAGGLGAVLALALGLRTLRDPLPFGPFFLVGGCAALLLVRP